MPSVLHIFVAVHPMFLAEHHVVGPLNWPWSKFGELASILGAWWEAVGRWVLQVLLHEVLTIGILRRGLASALVAREHYCGILLCVWTARKMTVDL